MLRCFLPRHCLISQTLLRDGITTTNLTWKLGSQKQLLTDFVNRLSGLAYLFGPFEPYKLDQTDGKPLHGKRERKQMNKLKKLFAPRALAATLATGMLLHAAVAWAGGGCTSVSTSTASGGCGGANSTPCSQSVTSQDGCFWYWGGISTVYWCCPTSDYCTGLIQPSGPPFNYCYGNCCPT